MLIWPSFTPVRQVRADTATIRVDDSDPSFKVLRGNWDSVMGQEYWNDTGTRTREAGAMIMYMFNGSCNKVSERQKMSLTRS
jgi:hypothetical protein